MSAQSGGTGAVKKIRSRLSALIAEGETLLGLARKFEEDWSKANPPRTPYLMLGESVPREQKVQSQIDYARSRSSWLLDVERTLEYAGLHQELAHLRRVKGMGGVSDAQTSCSQICGILESAKRTVDDDFLGGVRELVHADLFDSLADQADELLSAGHTIPAAVLARIILERWLRDEATRAAIPTTNSKGKPLRAGMLNDQLKAKGVFSTTVWKQVDAQLSVGNVAAHPDNAGPPHPHDVQQLLTYVRAKCL